MRIGIDVSQLAYSKTGVANYLEKLVESIVSNDLENEYVFFYSSLRIDFKPILFKFQKNPKITFRGYRMPPILLDIMWNRLHIFPIEMFTGPVDIFITSDWTEPPTKRAKKATIIYDLIVYKYPEESHNRVKFNPLKLLITPNIVTSQKRKLKWVKKESNFIFAISESTKKDIEDILKIDNSKIKVIYPGLL